MLYYNIKPLKKDSHMATLKESSENKLLLFTFFASFTSCD